MKTTSTLWLISILSFSLLQVGAARHGQYDDDAREQERIERETEKKESQPYHPVRGIASGIKQSTVTSTSELLEDTVETTAEEAPIKGTVDGAREGSAKAVDNAVKGAFKIATLGYADVKKVDVQQPEASSEDVTKFKIKW